MSFKETLLTFFEITCSTLLASILGYFSSEPDYSDIFLISSKYFGVLTLIFGILWLFYDNFELLIWNLKMRVFFFNPRIGILGENSVRPHFTRYTVEDWVNAFQDLGYTVQKIRVNARASQPRRLCGQPVC